MLLLVLTIAMLAVVRITRLLVTDELTSRYRRWVVSRWGENSMAAYLAHCPWCTSIYVATIVMPIATFWPNRWVLAVLLIPATSMLSGLILDRE